MSIGTTTPRDYSSDIQLVDKTRNVDTPQKIWMNNPMRFAGERGTMGVKTR